MPSTRPSPALHLALPGLCWPAHALHDLVFDLSLPALSMLLGKGSVQHYSVTDTTAWLGQLAGLGMQPLPVAALRRLALEQTTDGHWLCLDPVHLRVEKTQLIVSDPADLQLSTGEAEALAASVAPLLAEELGVLHVGTADNWHLNYHSSSTLHTAPLPDAIGLNADILMPRAENIRIWRRVLNEIQMTLHTHPVNVERSARGLPVVNSLWPWGEGNLPPAAFAAWDRLHANGLLWQGMASYLGYALYMEPTHYSELFALAQPASRELNKILVISESLATATRMGDAMRWRDALQTLEDNCFAPVLAAWQAGELSEVGIHGSGAGHGISFVVHRNDRWRFWRKAAPLTVLGTGEVTGPAASRKA